MAVEAHGEAPVETPTEAPAEDPTDRTHPAGPTGPAPEDRS